jgi:hypothetical protein
VRGERDKEKEHRENERRREERKRVLKGERERAQAGGRHSEGGLGFDG